VLLIVSLKLALILVNFLLIAELLTFVELFTALVAVEFLCVFISQASIVLVENLLGLIVFFKALLSITFLRHFSLNLLNSLSDAISVLVRALVARPLMMQLQLSDLVRGRVMVSSLSVLVH
jgi:hypothetical protein